MTVCERIAAHASKDTHAHRPCTHYGRTVSDDSTEPGRTRAGRWSVMMDRLATSGRLGVAEAAGMLGVSEATIRRDFTELARRQLVARNHGGVVATSVAYELPYSYRSTRDDDDRSRVAAAAAGLVEGGEVIGLNGGTTTTATCRAITAREELAGPEGITIVTNALNIATEAVLRPHIQCVSLGGVARRESYELTGPLALLALQQLWLDVAIIGVDGLTAHEGATCAHEDEAAIVQAMIGRARRVVCVATSDKVGKRTFASICLADRLDHVVTTQAAAEGEVAGLRAAGVHVLVV